MLQHIDSQDFALADTGRSGFGGLLPSEGRPPAGTADVLQLLTLTFGRAEALRRLQY
jgi:hypothetical protein